MKSIKKGIFFIIASAFFFALMILFVKMAGDIPSVQKSFFRNVVALLIATASIIRKKESFRWKKGNLPYILARAAFGTIGLLCNFYAVDHLVLSDASMLNKMSPFFVVVFSFLLLREPTRPLQILAVVGAFLSSLLIIKPGFSMDTFPAVIGFIGGMGAGAAYTMVRFLGKREENNALIVFYFSAFSTLVTFPPFIFAFHPMTMEQWIYLILAGIAAAGGQFSITAAYFHAPAREISIFDYSQILFATFFSMIVFGQLPDIYSVLGYIGVCAMAMLTYFYNRRLHQKEMEKSL